MTTYTIVFEKTDTGFSAYSPELPGMGVAGETLAETRQLAIEAIDFHLDGYAQRPKTIAMVSSPNLIVNCATFGPPAPRPTYSVAVSKANAAAVAHA